MKRGGCELYQRSAQRLDLSHDIGKCFRMCRCCGIRKRIRFTTGHVFMARSIFSVLACRNLICRVKSKSLVACYLMAFTGTFTGTFTAACNTFSASEIHAADQDNALEPTVKKVFVSNTHGITRYRIPGLVVTGKGTLLAYCEARRNSSSDWGEIEVHLRRSTDNGENWGEQVKIAHHGQRIEGNPEKPIEGKTEQTVNNPVAIVDSSGAIHFLYCINYAECFHMVSTDDGVSWSSPRNITECFEPLKQIYPWTVIATGPGHGVQMTEGQASGRLIVPIWIAYGTGGAHRPSASGTIYSDDHGKTWTAGEIAFPNESPFRNPNETVATTLKDGRLLLINRNESDRNRKLISVSDDGATGWSKPQFVEDLWEPICMSSVVRYPGKEGYLIYSGVRSLALDKDQKEIPGKSGKRHRLSIQVSHDNGANWPILHELEGGPSAYSDLAISENGEVLCLYEAGSDIHVARFAIGTLLGSK